MSLTKRPVVTPEKLTANRANGAKSRGPATAEGLERTRDSKIRHGFYAQADGEALRALGEDPDEFDRLLRSLEATWQPADELQMRLVARLARAVWRLERADRVQESMAMWRAEEAQDGVDSFVSEECQCFDEILANLEELAEAVAADEYATTSEELDAFQNAYGDSPEGRPQEILELMTRLLEVPEPIESAPGEVEDSTVATEDPAQPEYHPEYEVDSGIFMPLPDVPVAEGKERAPIQKKLARLLQGEIADQQAARERKREGLITANARFFRDEAIAPKPAQAQVLFRMEDSSFRQIGRLTDLLLKLKRNAAPDTHER